VLGRATATALSWWWLQIALVAEFPAISDVGIGRW